MMYLTGASNPSVRRIAKEAGIGLLIQPGTKGYVGHIPDYAAWTIDNGCFNRATYVGDEAYLAWLEKLPRTALFAPAPDVVGDAAATLAKSLPVLAKIRALGFKAAFVAQDGSEAEGMIPWEAFDVLFIGGSTEWKLGPAAAALIAEARARGKGVHMGRVNSGKRYKLAMSLGAHTADGTYLAFGPSTNLPKLLGWIGRADLAVN